MTRAKVCGLTREADVAAAVGAGADALGFVVDVPVETPREVAPERAADLVSFAPPFVTTVLVTMPESAVAALELADRVGANAIQIHGRLADEELARLATETDRTVVAAVDASDADVSGRADLADAVLVDSTDESGAGGTGRTHDWERTRALAESLSAPVVLAGGLTPENVAEAVETVEPYAVDVATGVEARSGEKDHDAVAAFVEGAKRGRMCVEP